MATIKRDNEPRVFEVGTTIAAGPEPGRYRQKDPLGYKEQVFEIYRDDKGKLRLKTDNPADEFRKMRSKAQKRIKPMQNPTEFPDLEAIEPGFDPNERIKPAVEQFLNDPNVPEWRKRRFRQMNRKDI